MVIAASAVFVAWLYLAIAHGGFWRTEPLLRRTAGATNARRVVAVIPARDEAETIGAAVRSLVHQVERVIVVDDGSSDGTAGQAEAAGALVVTGKPLPTGWTGKLWALHQGIELALPMTPHFLLFTDADIRHGVNNVQSLVDRAETERRDLVSYMARLKCESLAERLLIPAFVFFFFMLCPPVWIADGRHKTAGAAGGCILIRPDVLKDSGGIEGMRSALIDDCTLADRVKRVGGSLWLGMVEDTESLRDYSEFRDVRKMISRTAFTQLNYSTPFLLGTIAGMCFLYLLPVALALTGDLVGLLAWLLMALIYVPIAKFYRQSPFMGMLLPLIAGFYLFATVESAVRYWSGNGGAWKGRNQAPSPGGAAKVPDRGEG